MCSVYWLIVGRSDAACQTGPSALFNMFKNVWSLDDTQIDFEVFRIMRVEAVQVDTGYNDYNKSWDSLYLIQPLIYF